MTKAWRKIETSPTHNFKEEPELIGEYIGVEEEVGENHSKLYTFKNEKGDLISVWGNTLLDIRLKNLVKGEMVKIVYLGLTKSEKTSREFHNFDIYHKEADFSKIDDIPVINEELQVENEKNLDK